MNRASLSAGLFVAASSLLACGDTIRGVDITPDELGPLVCPQDDNALSVLEFTDIAYERSGLRNNIADLSAVCSEEEAAEKKLTLEDCGTLKTLTQRGFIDPSIDFARTVTREEAAAILVVSNNLVNRTSQAAPYSDVESVDVDILYSNDILVADPVIVDNNFYPNCGLSLESAESWVSRSSSNFGHQTFCGVVSPFSDYETQIRRLTDMAQLGCIVSEDLCLTYDCSNDPSLSTNISVLSRGSGENCGGAEAQAEAAEHLIDLQSQCEGEGIITYGTREVDSCYISVGNSVCSTD